MSFENYLLIYKFIAEIFSGSNKLKISIQNFTESSESQNLPDKMKNFDENHAILEKYTYNFVTKYPNYLSKTALLAKNYCQNRFPETCPAPDRYRTLTQHSRSNEEQERNYNLTLSRIFRSSRPENLEISTSIALQGQGII